MFNHEIEELAEFARKNHITELKYTGSGFTIEFKMGLEPEPQRRSSTVDLRSPLFRDRMCKCGHGIHMHTENGCLEYCSADVCLGRNKEPDILVGEETTD